MPISTSTDFVEQSSNVIATRSMHLWGPQKNKLILIWVPDYGGCEFQVTVESSLKVATNQGD